MKIFKTSFSPPRELKTDRFQLFPTSPELFQSDYSAVMQSRELLRVWSQSVCPEDTFTAEENQQDLEAHVRDNEDHSAYGYMLYSPDRATCLGSVYVNPLSNIALNYVLTEDDQAVIANADARIDCWVSVAVDHQFELHILTSIQSWLTEEWKLEALFSARTAMKQRIETYEKMKLNQVASLIGHDGNVGLLLYR